jgi:AAA+ ATPase superfamily predicted ATPase
MKLNPFLISGYMSPEYFCDRDNEAMIVTDAILNKRHLTIFSPRRIGKTGLIKHVFHTEGRKKKFIPVYTDILATGSLGEFTESFGRAVLSVLAKNESAIGKILKTLASIRPKAGIDPVTGEPYIGLTVNNDREAADSLDMVFRYLQSRNDHFALAIDEFQQVVAYPEKNVEAILRTHLQETGNISMIFSGSRKHLLTGIFSSPDRPFYNSTKIIEIGKINESNYREFVREKFEKGGIKTDPSGIDVIFRVTEGHTFYVQYLCNRLFSNKRAITADETLNMLRKIINENEAVYASYIALLTPLQFKTLRAIALNSGVRNPTSSEFLKSNDLGAASSVSLAVRSLTDKGFLDLEDNTYTLNDKFFNSWLRYKSGSV